MYHWVVFDIDGTLVDTKIAILSSLQRLVAEELGKHLGIEELEFAFGIPGEETLKRLGIANLRECSEKWGRYMRECSDRVRVFDGVRETLAGLKKRGVSMGIVTSKTREEYLFDFVPHGLAEYFGVVVCADDTERHKPHPDPILKFIELSGADKSKTIYIGDTRYDMECALGAGVSFGLAGWGSRRSMGIDAGCVLETPEQILNFAHRRG